MSVYVSTRSVADLRRKAKAFKVLFGVAPLIQAFGTFVDDKGGEIPIYAAARTVVSIGTKYALVGTPQTGEDKLAAAKDGYFSLELPIGYREGRDHA